MEHDVSRGDIDTGKQIPFADLLSFSLPMLRKSLANDNARQM